MNIFPPSAKRVFLSTNKQVNQKIKTETLKRIKLYRDKTPIELSERINQLNKEWDTERILEANASFIILISSILGFVFSYYWFFLVGVISFFLLVHAIQGWCPPVPLIRRLGIRTPEEISDEKTVIKYIRGDFANIENNPVTLYEIMNKD